MTAHPANIRFRGKADNAESPLMTQKRHCQSTRGLLGSRKKAEGLHVMSVTDRLDQTEDILGCDVSDEALESSAGAGIAAVVCYTLAHCTSLDCALLS